MILIRFTKTIDGRTVDMLDAVYAKSRKHVPDHMGRDVEWHIEEVENAGEISPTIRMAVAQNGFSVVKVRRLIRQPLLA